MSAIVATDSDGNQVMLVSGWHIKYAQVGGHIGVSDLDSAMYLAGVDEATVRGKLNNLLNNKTESQKIYGENPILYQFNGIGRRKRPLLQKDGLEALRDYVRGSHERVVIVKEALDGVQSVCKVGRHTFPTDDAGNSIIPADVFGGMKSVRVKANENNVLIIDVVQAIMAIKKMKKNLARLCWSDTLKEHRRLVLEDLSDNQGDCFRYLFWKFTL